MAWDFNQIIEFGRQFSGPNGTELAFVLSEWTPEDGLALTQAYSAVYSYAPPTEDMLETQANRIWVKINNGVWQRVVDVVSVTNIGFGTNKVLQSGVQSSMVIVGWQAKGIAAGYVIASGTTLDAINADRTTGLALIRTYINEADGEVQPLAPDEPFTAGQVGILATWLNDHNITNQEFADLFDVTAAQLSNWLTTHSRIEFAQQIHDRFA